MNRFRKKHIRTQSDRIARHHAMNWLIKLLISAVFKQSGKVAVCKDSRQPSCLVRQDDGTSTTPRPTVVNHDLPNRLIFGSNAKLAP